MNPHFNAFLNELSQALELAQLKADSHGACLVLFKKESASLLFEYDESLVPQTILLSSEICPLSQEILLDIFEESLIANESLDETLSCHLSDQILYLHRRLHPEISSEEIQPLLSSFLNTITDWREKVSKQRQNPSKRQRIPTPPSQISITTFKA